MNMPKQVDIAFDLLFESGFEAYLVGGCVRDNLLGREQKDFDITTNAEPDEVIKIFTGYKVIETGLKHGTVTVMINALPIEITTYRVDGEYLDNRRPENVTFTKSLKEDLARRDFTINAICYNPIFKIVDYFGGKEDLQNKIIRAVGDPQKRFEEDALRILRALRFSATLGFEIESKTKRAIFSHKELLKNISAERIAAEFIKIISAPFVGNVLKEYAGVLAVWMPEISPMIGFSQHTKYHCYDVFNHSVEATNCVVDNPALKLAAFFHDIGKPQSFSLDETEQGHFYGHAIKSMEITKDILFRLKLDNNTIERVLALIKYHDVIIEANEKAVKRWLNKLTPPVFMELLELKKADCLAQSEVYRFRIDETTQLKALAEKIIKEGGCFSLKDLSADGNDLLVIGICEGKEIGEILNELLELVMDGKIPNEKEALISYVRDKRCL